MLCNYALVIGESLLSSLMLSHGLASPHSKDTTVENQQPAEASGVARSWVQSMFSRDTASKSTSFSGVRKWTSDGSSDSGWVCSSTSCLIRCWSRWHCKNLGYSCGKGNAQACWAHKMDLVD